MKKGARVQCKNRPGLVGIVDRVDVLGAPKPTMVRLFWDKLPDQPKWFCAKNLKVLPDEIDFSDGIRGAVRKTDADQTKITIRMDTDIIEWFRDKVRSTNGGNYQILMNTALRKHINPRAIENAAKIPVPDVQNFPPALSWSGKPREKPAGKSKSLWSKLVGLF